MILNNNILSNLLAIIHIFWHLEVPNCKYNKENINDKKKKKKKNLRWCIKQSSTKKKKNYNKKIKKKKIKKTSGDP